MIVFADSGKSTIVMDVDSGRVLYSNNPHSKMLIASTTKIMTCMIVLENIDLNHEITVGDEVLKMYGTNIYIEPGEVLTVKDLLYGLMLRSGNDAAEVLATHTFPTYDEFILKMNEKAKEIGMKDTSFSNPHGLDEESENYSTAYDMALLSQYAYHNPVYQEIISTKKYSTKSSIKSYLWYNRMNLLTEYSNCIGGKNGYTPKAGKTLVSIAKKDDLTLTIVSLKDSNLYQNHKSLYEKYFHLYHNYKIIDSNSFFVDPSLVNHRSLFVKDDFVYPLKEDELSKISTLVKINDHSSVGEVEISFQEEIVGKVSLYEKSKKKKERKTFFQKILSYFEDSR